ncbi:MAG: putative baseplate assembly protein [Anaerolineae bacterium]|nr:putative baseplate assembly protein [Anaerolineae bacterium]
MPIQLPYLDDRNFEQLFEEAKRRIAVHTPEWTNFESDPGITLVQVFAFLTDSLLYRANRIPERNRVKFLQLLGVGLQPAAAADGIIAISNERGPVKSLPLLAGVVVSAGSVDFLTRDAVNVLPLEAQVYYKKPIPETDPRYEEFLTKHEAILAAQLVEQSSTSGTTASLNGQSLAQDVKLDFYETVPLVAPSASDPNPEVDLNETSDRAVYLALLAPKNVAPADARAAIANQTLSIGVVPALDGTVPSLEPFQPTASRDPVPSLVYEIPNAQTDDWSRLRLLLGPDVLSAAGIVQVELPAADRLKTWDFSEPLDEGTEDYPPRLEDDEVKKRLVTWLRVRLPAVKDTASASGTQTEAETPPQADARLTWLGVNAARVSQAVPVSNELLGQGTGEPDQVVVLANTPVIKGSARLAVEDENGIKQLWRLTDDLLAAGENDRVFTLDPESGQIRFGDGLRGARPPAKRRIIVSYEYGGGPQGNVGIGALNASRDVRLQGGYKIANPVPTSGGSLGETVAEGERNIPLYLRHRERLVTIQDFEDITLRTPGVDVGRVEVLPLFDPDNTEELAPGMVTLVVIPSFDAISPLWPVPDRLFLRRVCDHLDACRLVTTEVHVRGPVYVDVYVSVGIQLQSGFFSDQVRQTVSDRLNGYLSSLPLGGPLGQGWPLNKRLLDKDLEAVVTRVPGVEFVHSLEMGVGTPVNVPEYDLAGLKLPRLVGLSVQEGTAEPLAEVFAQAPSAEPPSVVPVPVLKKKC